MLRELSSWCRLITLPVLMIKLSGRCRIVAVLMLLILSGGSSAIAAQITSVENPSEHLGFVNIYGVIETGDSAEFKHITDRLIKRGDTIFLVNICSVGGNVLEAMNIGEQIRAVKARTRTAAVVQDGAQISVKCGLTNTYLQTDYVAQTPSIKQGDVNADCASACFLVWASGIAREGDYVGVHRPIFDPRLFAIWKARNAEAEFLRASSVFKQYLRDREVPSSIIDIIYATGSNKLHYLSADELALMRSVPWLEELIRARCGERPQHLHSGAGPVYMACVRVILKEEQLEGVKEYSKSLTRVAEAAASQASQPKLPTARSIAKSGEASSYWQFYGSQLYMTKQGAQRKFFFKTPRDGLAALGITKGSLFFEGAFSNKTYDGSAIAYAKDCKNLSYSVRGQISADERTIIFKGLRPTRDETCSVIGMREVTITMTFSQANAE